MRSETTQCKMEKIKRAFPHNTYSGCGRRVLDGETIRLEQKALTRVGMDLSNQCSTKL